MVYSEIPVAGEPVPEWNRAKPRWGIWWEVHWISLGAAFVLLSVIFTIALLKSSKRTTCRRKPYIIAINVLLVVLCATRALYLLLDPYGSRQKLPRWLAGLLFNISFPCLTSAFCLILYVFLGVARLQLISKRLQNARFFVAVISFHFTAVLVAVICVILAPQIAEEAYVFCHLFFILWGLVLSVTFIYGGIKVIRSVKMVSKQLQRQSRTNASKVGKVTVFTSVLGLACSILHFYSLYIVYRFYRDPKERPEPWMWWAFQTCFRLIEIAMICNISYCILQRSYTRRRFFLRINPPQHMEQ